MKVACFVNNRLGCQAVEWLRLNGDTIVALVIHEETRRKYGVDICAAAGVSAAATFEAAELVGPQGVQRLGACGADVGLSVLFGYRLAPAVIGLFPRGCFNLHPALLPFNRGADPNVWAIVEGSPAGTTLHWMDEGIDTGPIVAQREVPVASTDTAATLYRRLEDESLALLAEAWPLVASGRAPRTPQPAGGSTHRRADLQRINRIEPDRLYRGQELIDLLRAQTFPPHAGMTLERGGRRVSVRVELAYEDESSDR